MTEQVRNLMTKLNISEAEAIRLIEDDKEIDRMTSQKEIDGDLTEEQIKVKKSATITVSEKKTTKHTHTAKADPAKERIIEVLAETLQNNCSEVKITNKTREITFTHDNVDYKLTLTTTRKNKGE